VKYKHFKIISVFIDVRVK